MDSSGERIGRAQHAAMSTKDFAGTVGYCRHMRYPPLDKDARRSYHVRALLSIDLTALVLKVRDVEEPCQSLDMMLDRPKKSGTGAWLDDVQRRKVTSEQVFLEDLRGRPQEELIPFDTKSAKWYHFYGKYGRKIQKMPPNKKAPTL
jgi:hypothetical protein